MENKNLTKLRKQLYLAAREVISEKFKDDPEAVKALRDETTRGLFAKNYKDLSWRELVVCITELYVVAGQEPPVEFGKISEEEKTTASKNQIKILRYYAIAVAINRMPFEGIQSVDTETGVILEGEDLRRRLQLKWMNKNGYLETNLHRRIYETYINPKSHQFLVEGNFKKFVKNDKYMAYDSLKPQEIQYLITRWKKIYSNDSATIEVSHLASTASLN